MDMDTMTPKEVSEALKVSQATVYRWAKEGVIPSTRLGRSLRFNRSAVEAQLGEPDAGEPSPTGYITVAPAQVDSAGLPSEMEDEVAKGLETFVALVTQQVVENLYRRASQR